MILGRNQQALTMARTRSSRLAGVAVALAIFLAAAATAAATKGPATPTAPAAPAAVGDFAGLVDIGGGRRLYLECRGQGSPTVVLEAGYRNHGGIWSVEPVDGQQPTVLHGVAAFARVCSYDRPGTVLSPEDLSRSDPVPQPRTAQDIVTDLHALLHAAAVAEPYVLVGHSDGGLFVRLYASTYPGEVVGMVLVGHAGNGCR